MRTIEALPPGLYEMVVDRAVPGEEVVYFEARDTMTAMGCLAVYANPFLRPRPELVAPFRPPAEPEPGEPVRRAIDDLDRGGYAEAIVRMCVILSRAGGQFRQDRLERFSAMLHSRAPFDSLSAETRRRMIDTQSRLVETAGDAARAALMKMLKDDVDRFRAVNIVLDVVEIGPESPRPDRGVQRVAAHAAHPRAQLARRILIRDRRRRSRRSSASRAKVQPFSDRNPGICIMSNPPRPG